MHSVSLSLFLSSNRSLASVYFFYLFAILCPMLSDSAVAAAAAEVAVGANRVKFFWCW